MDQVLTVVYPSGSQTGPFKDKLQVRVVLLPTQLHIWKKNKKKRLSLIPVNLCWLIEQVVLGATKKDFDSSTCFEVIGPSQRWLLAAKSENEKRKWISSIEDSIKFTLKSSTIPTVRIGSYDFGPNVGVYDGEWLGGHPHGKGRFTSSVDGTIFHGDWSSMISAGYGVIISPNPTSTNTTSSTTTDHQEPHVSISTTSSSNTPGNQTYRNGGWESFFPDEPPREAHNDVLDSNNDSHAGLTDSDVEMLISNATTRRYSKGDVILHEGEVNDCLYRIKSGVISLTQDVNGQATMRAEMGPDQMFGEMSVLDKNIISATVIATSDTVELYTIDLDVLYELFKTCPGFSKRFHHAMAETLAARLMRFFEPRMGKSMKQTFSGPLPRIPNETRLSLEWVEAWNTRSAVTSKYYLDLMTYRDPWVPNGINGKIEIQQHINNLQESGRYWSWEDITTSSTAEGFRMLCKVQLTSSRTGALSREDAVVDVILNRKEHKFKSISIHFDKEKLIIGQPVSDVRGALNQQPLGLGRVQDVKYCDKFNLPSGETVLAEKVCVLVSPNLSSNVPGTVYVSQNFICFYSKVFGMKTKEVIPVKAIKSIKKKQAAHGLLIKYNLKAARKMRKTQASSDAFHHSSGYDKNLELLLTFPSDFEENFSEISNLINKSSNSSSSGPSISVKNSSANQEDSYQMDGFRVAAESVIQKFARCSRLHESLPDFPVRRSLNEQSVRITGPNATETMEGYAQDLSGRIVSTYPRTSVLNADGKVKISDTRQGDPICDQFCIERLENKAIFALADGCNWGAQPRRAALLASKTFCEFVKHNLSAMTNLQEAGRLFLYAFAAAHHRIVEGFENKVWECGTTTLLGGSILELAPNDKYVERRWAVVIASIGDCKGFLISARHKTVIDITTGSRTGTASIDASDCGGRLGPYVGEGNPDLRNLSLFYAPAEEGDVAVFTSDGVYDNLDPQSLGFKPSDLGLEGDSWDKQSDYKKVEDVKTQFVCEKLRELVFGPKEEKEEDGNETSQQNTTKTESHKSDSKIDSSTDKSSRDSSPSSSILQGNSASQSIGKNDADIASKAAKLDTASIVETLIAHAVNTTQSSRDFMENFPDKILPKDYSLYPGKLDHTTCIALKVKRSTFKPVENELDSLVLRMRNPAQGLSTVTSGSPFPQSSLSSSGPTNRKMDLSALSKLNEGGQLVTLTKGDGIESPRWQNENNNTESETTEQSSTNTSSSSSSNTQAASSMTSASNSSTAASSGTSKASSANSNETKTTKPGLLRRTNTILNVAIRGSVILKWLRENEHLNEDRASKVAQHLLSFRYIRPLDVESWKNESFSGDMSYNFQVYEPIMTRNDWEQLLRASTRVTIPKGTVIIKEGEDTKQRLYYIISGKCRTVKSVRTESKKKSNKDKRQIAIKGDLEKNKEEANNKDSTTSSETIETKPAQAKLKKTTRVNNDKQDNDNSKQDLVVGFMCENETFGEISFLFGFKAAAKASASVVAEEDVDLYIIEGSWINILFVKYPGMAGRFYHYLASTLAHRLKKQEILEYQRKEKEAQQ